MCRISRIILSGFILVSMISAQGESSFKLYGFMDAGYLKFWLPDNSLLNMQGFNEKSQISVDNINLYTSFTPNGHIKSLIEIAYHNKPMTLAGDSLGTIIRVDPLNSETVVNPGRTAAINKTDKRVVMTEYGDIAVERAQIEVKFNQYLNLKCGKFITQYGIWNVDHGSPVLLTIRQPYEVGLIEIFPKSQIGLAGNGKIFLGDNDLDYTVYMSSGRNGMQIDELKDLAGGANLSFFTPVVAQGLTLGVSGYTGILKGQTRSLVITMNDTTFNNLKNQSVAQYTKSLTNEAIASGRYTQEAISAYVMSRISDSVNYDMSKRKIPGWFNSSDAQNPDNHSYRDNISYKSREVCLGFDFRLKLRDFSVQGELNYQRLKNYLKGSDNISNVLSWYILGSYAIPLSANLTLTPYAMFEMVNANDPSHNPGTAYFSEDLHGFQVFVIGLNFRIFQNFLTKIEYSNLAVLPGDRFKNSEDALRANALALQFSVGF